jgi:broad specificity phosphatase PhoE
MKLIFVRHGETREGKKRIVLGSRGGHLTIQGKREAKSIAHELVRRDVLPDIIITSPLARASDTANIIAQTLKCNTAIDRLARERSAGVAEGKKESKIDWNTYEQKPLTERKHQGGESFSNVYSRAVKFVNKLNKKYSKKNVLVVSHSVFILMCLAFIKNKSISYILKHKPKDKIIVIKNKS